MNETTQNKDRKFVKPAVFVGLLLVLLLLGRHFGWTKLLGGKGSLAALKALVAQNPARAAALYCAVTIAGCVIFALPGVTFAVLAGMAFGPLLGTLLCSLATTAGAGLAFLVGRFFLRDSLKPVVMRNKYLKKWLFDQPGKNDVLLLMITRLVPLFPYNLQNFAYGVTGIGLWPYTLCTFLFMAPGVAFFTLGAAGLGAPENRALYLLLAGALAVLVTMAGLHLRRRYVRDPDA